MEDDLLRKIEQFKAHYLSITQKAETLEKDLALSEIKVEEILKKTKDVE